MIALDLSADNVEVIKIMPLVSENTKEKDSITNVLLSISFEEDDDDILE
jgi:hypothetical protein